ncbi:hypothetical protein EXN66_Car017072 [Channa argus]|uniref:Uncharacterized protein n=1 Tax=Channa argus TaxID=215402 RepID=A0A6G1QG19_CHAAH|nr:hypothetical protein EXN66_Car017072 [Channa argus]
MSSRESGLFLMQCRLGAQRSHAPIFDLRIPLDSLNLLMILYPVDGGIFKVFTILS